jgi:hypothetical protein
MDQCSALDLRAQVAVDRIDRLYADNRRQALAASRAHDPWAWREVDGRGRTLARARAAADRVTARLLAGEGDFEDQVIHLEKLAEWASAEAPLLPIPKVWGANRSAVGAWVSDTDQPAYHSLARPESRPPAR